MEIVAHADTSAFAKLAGPVLEADPQRHTVALTVLDAMVGSGNPSATMLTLHEGDTVVGALLRTPGRPALGSAVPTAHAAAVVEALAELDPELPGVSGPVAEAEAFAAAYTARHGHTAEIERTLRLFALGTLEPPSGVPGRPRRAGAGDLDLLGAWRAAFSEEIRDTWTGPIGPRHMVERSLRAGSGEMLWEVDGTVVAQAAASRPTAGMSRIGPVYTPPEHRNHGYATAVTAAASQWALDAGADPVLLFTDLADSVTNRLYPRIGYRPVHDAVEVTFVR